MNGVRSLLLAAVVPAAIVALLGRSAGAQAPVDSASSYSIDRVRVIHQPRPAGTNVIAVHLYLLGGARQITAANAGVEPFLLMASEYGTRKYPGESSIRALARTGSIISVDTERDWTVFGFHGIKQEFDSTWAVFADRLIDPTLDSTAVRVVRERMINSLANVKASPQSHVWFLADSVAYNGHPYANSPAGSPASLRSLDVASLRRYHTEHMVTSRMLLVVVGDIPRTKVENAVRATIAKLPAGSYKWSLPRPPAATKSDLLAVDRSMTTNYVLGHINGPARDSKDYPAFIRAMSLLSGFMSYFVREQNALSYSAYVQTLDQGAPAAAIYMSTNRPDSAMKVVNWLLGEYERSLAIPRAILRREADAYNRLYVFGTESATRHATMLAEAELYDGDFRLASRMGDLMRNVQAYQLRSAVRTYARNLQYVYLGDTSRITRAEFLKR